MKPPTKITYSSQEIDNLSFDDTTGTKVSSGLGFDGQNAQKLNADNLAIKVTEVGTITYVALAAPGSLESASVWQCKKIDETTGTVITYADGDANFNNIATDLAALTYS